MIIKKHFEIGETAVSIIAEEKYISPIEKSIFRSREILERYILEYPEFRWSLEPLNITGNELIERMCHASKKSGVGPMAAVAGAIAEKAVQEAVDNGAEYCIVENGGDIAMILDRELTVGLFAPGLDRIGFRVKPRDSIFGICTSSATVGPSISFGKSDASVVISENVCLADACATKLGNLVTSDNDAVLKSALDQITDIEEVEGALIAINSKIAMKGNVPNLSKVEFDESDITRINFSERLINK